MAPHEQALCRRLALFAGGCTLEAAEAVCGGGVPAETVLEGLTALVDQSLLRAEEQGNAAPRLGMLETIREYAPECLAASGAEEAVRREHAAYYLALAEAAEPKLTSPEQRRWLACLETEHDNLRAALHWSTSHQPEIGLRLPGALWRFWMVRGYLSEGRGWLEDLLARSGGVAAPVRAKGLRGAGGLAFFQGDYGRAAALSEEELTLFRNLGDTRGSAFALYNLGLVAYRQGDYGRASALLEEALALFRDLGDTQNIGIALSNLGEVARAQGDYGRASALLAEALVLLQEVSDKWAIADCLERLARVACAQAQTERATRLCGAAAALRTAIGAPLPPDRARPP
jgi:tetratricopeptide (TPR) repeat protein